MKRGTKQGGILSPDLFSIYIDDLIKRLRELKLGCHIIDYFLACILFADDMTLIAPTRESMQSLIDACAQYCLEFCLTFKVKKSKVMIFGKIFTAKESLAGIYLNGERVDYVSKTKYLGFIVVSGRTFGFSVHEDLCGFFASANSVLMCTVKP